MVSRQPHVVACIQLNNRLPSRIVSFATAREIRKGEQACERQDTIALNAPSTRHSIASEGCPNSGAGAIRSGIAIFFFFFVFHFWRGILLLRTWLFGNAMI